MHLIGVDVGGTFTDIVYTDTDTNQTAIHKVSTTPDDPSVGAIGGIEALCARLQIDPRVIDHVLHGTTIATNAVLEYDGAKTGVVTNEGYRDILHIGRHQRPLNYSIMQDIPWQARPLARRRHRQVVGGRIAPPNGAVLQPLDEAAVREAARQLKADSVEAIAVCFLFSYIDSAHEERAKAIIEEEYPECFVTTSASIAPQFREFERFTTAAMNAFIGPKVRDYIANFEAGLKTVQIDADLHIMGSHGGAATAALVNEKPVLTLLSGPAAGVLGGAWSAELCGRDRLITFDVGGTSADIGIIIDGQFAEATARDTWIGGYPILVPMIDIETIGAGGGSIASVDRGGAFRVGPQSAGSRPAKKSRVLSAFSGGIDATYTAWRHKCAEHSVKHDLQAGLMVHGLDIPLNQGAVFANSLTKARRILDSAGMKLIPIATNLKEDFEQPWQHCFGAVIASCLHMFGGEYTHGLIGSSEPYNALVLPWGSNPVTDWMLSGGRFGIIHDGASLSRTEKVAAISGWTAARKNVRVCWEGADMDRNCGVCEKCIRTYLNFLVTGVAAPECFDSAPSQTDIDRILIATDAQTSELQAVVDYGKSHGVNSPLLARLEERLKGKNVVKPKLRAASIQRAKKVPLVRASLDYYKTIKGKGRDQNR